MTTESDRIKEREKRKERRESQRLKAAKKETPKQNNVKSPEGTNNSEESMASKVIVRNMIAYSNFRKMIAITLVNFLVLCVCLYTAHHFYDKPVEPRYLPVSNEGTVIPEIPLSEPNMNDGSIMEFALNAVRDINMYDYENWKAQLTNSAGYFTPQGWNSYLLEFEKSQTINTVKKYRMVVNMKPTDPPAIIRQGKFDKNLYVWIVEIPAEIRYISNVDSTTKTNPMRGVIRLTIIRTPTIDNPNGIGIQIYQFDTSRRTIK